MTSKSLWSLHHRRQALRRRRPGPTAHSMEQVSSRYLLDSVIRVMPPVCLSVYLSIYLSLSLLSPFTLSPLPSFVLSELEPLKIITQLSLRSLPYLLAISFLPLPWGGGSLCLPAFWKRGHVGHLDRPTAPRSLPWRLPDCARSLGWLYIEPCWAMSG